MKQRLAALSALALVACANPAEMRQRGPEAAFASPLPPEVVAACVATRWESAFVLSTPDVRVARLGDSITVGLYVPTSGVYTALLDVVPQGAGSASRYFKQQRGVEFAELDTPVRQCQEAQKVRSD